MFTTFFSVTFFILLTIRAVFAEITITTPSLAQCQPAHISWTPTNSDQGPFHVMVVNSTDPCGDPLADLGDQTGTSMTWKNVTLVAGTQVEVIIDSFTDEGTSTLITVGPSDDYSCLPKSEQASATAAVAAAEGVATTLVVPPPASSPPAQAAGAANAGLNPLHSSAISMSQISVPALWTSALVGVVSLFL
jgi:hypothetical protein